MKIKPISLLIFTLVIFVFFIFYKSLDKTNIYSPSVNLNKLIPEFDSKTFYTNTNFSNNDLKKNNYYLINIWASWCAPSVGSGRTNMSGLGCDSGITTLGGGTVTRILLTPRCIGS